MLFAGAAGADAFSVERESAVSLPAEVAEALRARNPGGRGGCPESNIFIHGFRYLDTEFDRLLWFLGAPDYLCSTNSFVPAIVTRKGEWTIGRTAREDPFGSRMLAGVPVLFQRSAGLGYFLTSEWRAGGQINYLYHSQSGETWVSVPLPKGEVNQTRGDSSLVASIRRLCVAETGAIVVVYEVSPGELTGIWSSPVDESFPETVAWTRVAKLPDDARCDGVRPRDFMPRSLRDKTSDGAIFDVGLDWRVRIPGPTK